MGILAAIREDHVTPTHILFDFFGTLVGYSASLREQGYQSSYALLTNLGFGGAYDEFLDLWSEVFHRLEGAAGESLCEFSMKDVAAAFLREAVGEAPETVVRDFARTYLGEWNRGVIYEQPVLDWLPRLAERFQLGIVTNTHDRELVPKHLEGMGVRGLFGCVVSSVEHGIRKPGAEIFRQALEELSAPLESCVFVGDSYEADYLGAERVGLAAFLIDPRGTAQVPAERRLRHVVELEERLLEVE